MRRILALMAALCLALGLTGCGQAAHAAQTTEPPAYQDAGDQAAQQGDFDAAVDAYTRAIAADQDQADAYMGRAAAYLTLAESGEDQPGPDLTALARQDHGRALALDPGLGDAIYAIYAARVDGTLDAGDGTGALLDMQTAIAAAPDRAGEFADRAKTITDQMLPGSVWYMDAPDSRYFELFADGSGRVLDAVKMEPAGSLTWENQGLTMTVTVEGESAQWTYAPDKASYYTTASTPEGDELEAPVGRASLRGMYARWQADILAQRAERLRDDTSEEEKAAVYDELCVREQTMLDALAETLGESVSVDADQDSTSAQETFNALHKTVNGLLVKLPEGEKTAASALGELFPIGDEALLDYFRLAADWSLRAQGLTVPEDASPAAWETLEDVDHYFADGRLYLLLEGYTRQRDDALTPESHGLYALQTPLTCWDDCTVEGDALLARLRNSRWLGLWEQYGGTFFLDLTLGKDGGCSAVGGHYPGPVIGSESGEYGLDGRELTLGLTTEGYLPGTYRYEVWAMGESLYCTLLTDGIVFGQTAGSRYLFCGGDLARDARTRIG